MTGQKQNSAPNLLPLRVFTQGAIPSMDRYLDISSSLVRALVKIHSVGVVHRGIQPDRVFICPSKMKSCFSIPLSLGNHQENLYSDVLIQESGVAESLAYMAPEQMGRSDVSIDQRTDIYSLGVVLYELACLHLPYEESDVTAWIHAHLAKEIVPPTHFNEALPRMVSSIVMKCLKKDPEERYQSAYGLLHDLQTCIELWRQNKSVSFFPLAQQDVQDVRRIFSELWERTEQLNQLSHLSPQGVTSQSKGKASIALLLGESGTGKTALLHKVIQNKAGDYSFTGFATCDSQPWTLRYGVVASAFRDILRKLLGQPSTVHLVWSKKLGKGLAGCGGFMLDILPELELFLKDKSFANPGESLTPSQAADCFIKLVEVLTEQGTVLICLDDLQWTDNITLQLMRHLLERRPANVTWLLSLNRSQLDQQGYLHDLLAELHQYQGVLTIHIQNFSKKTIGNMLSWTFPAPEDDMKPLADEIYRRTQGNPFLVRRWITRLQQTNSLWFDIDSNQWSWKLEPEHEQTSMDLQDTWYRTPFLFELDGRTLDVLRWAAVTGRQFDVSLIAEVSKHSFEEVENALSQAFEKQIIDWEPKQWKHEGTGLDTRLYSFTHDQIQQEYLTELSENQRNEMEYRIGMAMLERRVGPHEYPAAIFDIVDHLNAGSALRPDWKLLIELNLWAGQQAIYLRQYRFASEYFKTGLVWIGHLSVDYNSSGIIFELRLGLANSRFMQGQMDAAESEYLLLLDMASNSMQYAHVRLRLLRLYSALGNFDQARAIHNPSSFSEIRQLRLYGIVMTSKPYLTKAAESDRSHSQTLLLAEPYFAQGAFVAPWRQTISEALQSLSVAREHALTTQDLYLRVQIDLLSNAFQFASGMTITKSLSQLNDARAQYRSMHISHIESIFDAFADGYQSLSNPVHDHHLKTNDEFSQGLGNTLNLWLSLFRLIREFLLGDGGTARQLAEKLITEMQETSMPFYGRSDTLLLYAILLADECRKNSGPHVRFLQRKLVKVLRRFRTSSLKSEKHSLVLHLMEAEQARLKGLHYKAIDLYEKTSVEAHKLQFQFYSAIANERCADMVLEKGNNNYARALYTAAIDDYYVFGSVPKAKQLEEEHASVLRRGRGERRRRTGAMTDTSGNGSIGKDISQRIDWLMVSKAAQALSREVVLGQLLTRFISVVLESAGAQRGFILLAREERLYVEAFASVDDPHPIVLQGIPATDAWGELLLSVVDYTYRTTEDTLIDDASEHLPIQSDPYMPIGNPRSVLCLPMMSRQHVVGLLYLENNRMTRAFTESRLELMKVLTAQAAISLENAFLYESLEKKVAERTRELELSSAALTEANAQLEQANEELRQADRLRRELLANVSHDLRTPITLIAGYAEAITNGVAETEAEMKGFAGRIHDKTTSLTRLIEDLFNLVRLEAKPADFTMEPCTAEEFLVSMAMHFQGDVEQAGLEFFWSGVDDADITADGTQLLMDRDRMEQVFSNIIYNAIKHTESGGSIELVLEKEPDKVMYHIRDTGSGIAPESLPHIFERFYKVDKSRSKRSGGGLGLSIAKKIVELHGGEITAKSTLGEGTTFTITLNRQIDHKAPHSSDSAQMGKSVLY